jgi:hypothetical protein
VYVIFKIKIKNKIKNKIKIKIKSKNQKIVQVQMIAIDDVGHPSLRVLSTLDSRPSLPSSDKSTHPPIG